jgi:hypothetical protein
MLLQPSRVLKGKTAKWKKVTWPPVRKKQEAKKVVNLPS